MSTYPTHRNVDLTTLHSTVGELAAATSDMVVSASHLSLNDDGTFNVPDVIDNGNDPVILPRSTTLGPIAQEQLASRYGIPMAYWRKLDGDHLALRATNLNHWLARDNAKLLVRGLNLPDGGYTRAIMSDRYAIMDNSDILTATLLGMADAGLSANSAVFVGDLSERTMRLRVTVPEVAIEAGDLLDRYRSPFNGNSGRDLPLIFAGFELSNSEVGDGAFVVTPRMEVQVCTNGMTRKVDAVRAVHLGGRLEAGSVTWSDETRRNAIKLIQSKTADAVRQFLSPDYLRRQVDEMRAAAGRQVDDVAATIERVAKAEAFTADQSKSILDMFIKGGDTSVLGLGQAVTAAAQNEPDPDEAARMEASFWSVVTAA